MAATYLDASAVVKLVIDEPESDALRKYLRRRRLLVTSALVRAEVPRALHRRGAQRAARLQEVLGALDLVRVNDRVLNDAASLPPVELRALDAIHLATARRIGDLGTILTYDERMAAAARELGHTVAAPAP